MRRLLLLESIDELALRFVVVRSLNTRPIDLFVNNEEYCFSFISLLFKRIRKEGRLGEICEDDETVFKLIVYF